MSEKGANAAADYSCPRVLCRLSSMRSVSLRAFRFRDSQEKLTAAPIHRGAARQSNRVSDNVCHDAPTIKAKPINHGTVMPLYKGSWYRLLT